MLRLVSGWVLVNGLLMSPLWLSAAVGDGGGTAWLALEASLIVGLFALLPRRTWTRVLAWTTALGLVLATFVGFVDVVFQVSLARSLNLFLDLYLVGAVYHLAVGNSGLATTVAGFAGVAVALALATLGLGWFLTPAADEAARPGSRLPPRKLAVALVAIFALGLTGDATAAARMRLATPLIQLARSQADHLSLTLRERATFASELAASRGSYADVPGLLGTLAETDVLLAFVESYGMAALDDPEFAATVRPRLDSLAARVKRAGLHLVTGMLEAPTTGGQSWYAHGSVISGLWLENQLRYDLLMASDRETLVDDFRRAGHRTAAVMPAITMSWPEGIRLGYDEVYTRQAIPYAGPPLYWVSMPDQFTWSFVERTLLPAVARRPLFAEVALVSSHAPWVPVLPMLDWDVIGDGRAFEPYRQEGHPPEELWVDVEQLRRDYARSVDYSLQAMTGFAERSLDERTLLIVSGDHQAAPWVTGAAGSLVPVHVLAKDPALIGPFLEWGFRDGAFPPAELHPPRMDEFRDWFVHAFSGSPEATTILEKGVP